jgi:hypothetical protein
MTTRSIQIASQTFTKRASKLRLPYIDQCSAYYLFGGTVAGSLTNLAYGAVTHLTVGGTPTAPAAGYCGVNGTNYFNTGLVLDTPYTQVAVARMPTVGGISVLARQAGVDEYSHMLRYRDDQVDCFPDGSFSQGMSSANTNFRFAGSYWGGDGTRPALWLGIGSGPNADSLTFNEATTPVAKTITPTNSMRIGSSYDSTAGAGTLQVAAVAVYPFVMTVPQIKEVYRYLKAICTARGLTVY